MPVLTIRVQGFPNPQLDKKFKITTGRKISSVGSFVFVPSFIQGELDDNGEAVVEDIPKSPDGTKYYFKMADDSVSFEMPAVDTDLATAIRSSNG